MTAIPNNRKIDAAGSRQVKGIAGGGAVETVTYFTPTLLDVFGGATYVLSGTPIGVIRQQNNTNITHIMVDILVDSVTGTPSGIVAVGGLPFIFGSQDIFHFNWTYTAGTNFEQQDFVGLGLSGEQQIRFKALLNNGYLGAVDFTGSQKNFSFTISVFTDTLSEP